MLNSQDQFYTVQTFQRSPISQTSNWSGTFFCCFLQQTDSKKSCSKKLRLPCWGCVEIFTSFIYNSMHISFSSFPFFLQIQPSFINFFHSSIILLWILNPNWHDLKSYTKAWGRGESAQSASPLKLYYYKVFSHNLGKHPVVYWVRQWRVEWQVRCSNPGQGKIFFLPFHYKLVILEIFSK